MKFFKCRPSMLLEKRNMYNSNTGTAADKKREDCTVVRARGMNWKPSNKHARACTRSYTQCIYVRYQCVFAQFNIVQN